MRLVYEYIIRRERESEKDGRVGGGRSRREGGEREREREDERKRERDHVTQLSPIYQHTYTSQSKTPSSKYSLSVQQQ